MKKIKDLMSTNLITIKRDMPFTEACRLFPSIKIHHLPVLDHKGLLVGIFSTTDALYAINNLVHHKIESETDVNNLISIESIMTSSKIYTLSPNDSLEAAVEIFQELNIHSIPIVENNLLVGILTSHDILQEFRTLIHKEKTNL